MNNGMDVIEIALASCSLKEAKKKFCGDTKGYYIIDISKIIRDLGYDIKNLSIESEFIINYSIRKKIIQGIYSTRCVDILIIYKNITDGFIENLRGFLNNEFGDDFAYTIKKI